MRAPVGAGGPVLGPRLAVGNGGVGDWSSALDDIAALLLDPPGPVVLAAHVAPDGDALGSSLAVALALREAGVPAVVSWGDEPFEVPDGLGVLPGIGSLVTPPADTPPDPGVLACFDLAARNRLGVLEPLVERAQAVVAVDHHASHVPFAHVTALDSAAPATAVLAAALVERLAVPLDERIASCLWVGLVTDTGSFRHSSTTPGALRLAARLLEAGAPGAALTRAVLDDIPAVLLPVMGQALAGSVVEPDAFGGVGLVRAVVPLDVREAAGVTVEAVAPVLDVVRRPREADVAILLVGEAPDRWKLSLRSKGAVDVARAAVALGGGGHTRAAGATLQGPLETAERVVREAIEAVVSS